MTIAKRLYLAIGLVAIIALAFSAVTLTSNLTSAGGPDPTNAAQTCDQQDEAGDAAEAQDGPDTDNVEEQCGPQDEAEDAGTDVVVPCSDPAGADDDAAEAQGGPDTDNIEEQCGPQDEAD